jgi:hypothetical protein
VMSMSMAYPLLYCSVLATRHAVLITHGSLKDADEEPFVYQNDRGAQGPYGYRNPWGPQDP